MLSKAGRRLLEGGARLTLTATAALSLCACSKAPSSDAAHDAGEGAAIAAGAAGAIRALDFAPIAHFNNVCARCHGERGEFYGERFAQGYTDEALREIVAEMVFGPAMSSLGEAELEALVAYVRALAKLEPFLIVARAGADELSGEVSPGSQVRATLTDGGVIEARVDGRAWIVRKPEAMDDLRAAVRLLRASTRTAETSLEPRESAYSHAPSNHKEANKSQ